MSCSSASHWVPRASSSAASPLPSWRPQVSPGSKPFRRKPLPFLMRNGSTYFWMRSRISRLATAQLRFVEGAAPCLVRSPASIMLALNLSLRKEKRGSQHLPHRAAISAAPRRSATTRSETHAAGHCRSMPSTCSISLPKARSPRRAGLSAAMRTTIPKGALC